MLFRDQCRYIRVTMASYIGVTNDLVFGIGRLEVGRVYHWRVPTDQTFVREGHS